MKKLLLLLLAACALPALAKARYPAAVTDGANCQTKCNTSSKYTS